MNAIINVENTTKRIGFRFESHAVKFQTAVVDSVLEVREDLYIVTYPVELTTIEIGVDAKGRKEGYFVTKIVKAEGASITVQKMKMIDGKYVEFGATQNAKEFASVELADKFKNARIAKIIK